MTEVMAYVKPESGVTMVICPCRKKVRVMPTGLLVSHVAYDLDEGDDVAGYCSYSGWSYAQTAEDVFGYSGGVLSAPAAP